MAARSLARFSAQFSRFISSSLSLSLSLSLSRGPFSQMVGLHRVQTDGGGGGTEEQTKAVPRASSVVHLSSVEGNETNGRATHPIFILFLPSSSLQRRTE